jgi:nucleotide-binding universal stress UspA family protein
MNTLLVPTDFSLVADNALKYAMDMATHYQLGITLFHVVQLSAPDMSSAIYVDTLQDLNHHAEEKMTSKVNSLKEEYPHLTFNYKVESGLLLDSLNSYCEEIKPIAVVMGITGDGEGIDKIIGSNAILAMDNLTNPLIVVPKNSYFKSINKVCFACDLKNVAASTPLLAIKAFAKLFNSEVHILNIDYHNRNYSPNTQAEIDVLNLMFDTIDHKFHFIENESVQDAINEFIDTNDMEMLIMLPKKHSFFASLFKKSHTKEMLYHSHIPILALHHS